MNLGGYLEPNEDPLVAAKRELKEEMGFEAEHWVSLGSLVADANRGCGVGHLYFAYGAKYVGSDDGHDDLEEQVATLMSTEELEDTLLDQQFKVIS